MASGFSELGLRLAVRRDRLANRWQLRQITRRIAQAEIEQTKTGAPVVFFNASTRLDMVSYNAAYALLTAWGLRMAGRRVIHFVCQSGMSRCLLGSSEEDHTLAPPCRQCTSLSHALYAHAEVQGFTYSQDEGLAAALTGKSIAEMQNFEYQGIPLGEIVLPSIRWRMRRHHLEDDLTTRSLFGEFILSAYHVGKQFEALVVREQPAAVVVFNGQMFPEAVCRTIAQQHGITAILHESGLQPFTAFFTSGDATARRVYLSAAERTLTPAQNARLDATLEKRFQGKFSMAGISFWRDMQGLGQEFERKAAGFERIVPVFTNVIFDTSQAHANQVFEHMFAWLDCVLEIIRSHPETLFVLRAHPDEMRAGSRKKSRETVRQWVEQNQVADLPNVVFIDSQEFISSYDLIQRAKFVIAYNSSVGLEALLFGKAALCGGRAWYTDYPTVHFPPTPQAYRQQAEALLAADEIEVPETNRQTARSLLYYQNFRAALPFGDFLEAHALRGFVRFLPLQAEALSPERSAVIAALLDGIEQAQKTQEEFVLAFPDDLA